MILALLLMLAASLVSFINVPAARADIFIVRHAEKLDPKQDESLLSKRGHERAKELARALRSVPLKAVYCTEYERTFQTAQPSAEQSKLKPIRTKSDDVKSLAEALRARPENEDVLVVGHSDTIPELLPLLGADGPKEIKSDEFDNLWIVRLSSGRAAAHRLHYGR